MIYSNTTDQGGPIFPKKTPTGSKNAWNALLYAIGANKDVPFIAGKRVSKILDFPSTLTQTNSDLTITVDGAKLNDIVNVSSPVVSAGVVYSAFVSATNVVTVRLNNYSSNTINPAAAKFTVVVIPSGD